MAGEWIHNLAPQVFVLVFRQGKSWAAFILALEVSLHPVDFIISFFHCFILSVILILENINFILKSNDICFSKNFYLKDINELIDLNEL